MKEIIDILALCFLSENVNVLTSCNPEDVKLASGIYTLGLMLGLMLYLN